jgi:hypothetical protein
MKKLLLLLFSIFVSSSGLTDIQIKNFYFERTEYTDSTYIIISTNKATNVKCAIFDKNDKPVRVSNDIVTPPLSEVVIISSDAVITSAQCWEQEPTLEQVKETFILELIESLKEEDSKANRDLDKEAQEDILDELKLSYINQIANRVRENWRYNSAEDNWNCQVYILQSDNGTVESVNLQSCEIDNSARARSFKDSIERAVYKSSPLPTAPDESVFNREIFFDFRVN